jgi:hypothetical protein
MLQIGYNLHSLGQPLDDSLIAIAIIISLPDSYSTLRLILMATDLKLTTQSVKSSILQEEQLHNGRSGISTFAAQIQKKSTKGQKGHTKGKHTPGNDKGEKGDKDKAGNKKVCGYAGCGIKEHTDNECRKLKAVLEKYGSSKDKPNDSKPASSNTIVANRATTFSNDYDDDAIRLFTTQVQSHSPLQTTTPTYLNQLDNRSICLYTTHHAPPSDHHSWMVDSGATKPMSSRRNLFLSYCKLHTLKSVRLGDDSTIYAYGIGTISLEFNLNKHKREGTIKEVYYVPDLQGNLLSVSALTKRGYTFIFDLDGC